MELFAKACVQCHANDPKQLRVRDDIAGLIRQAQDDYEHSVSMVHDATVRGLATDDEQLLLQEAKTQVTQLEAMQHTLDVKQLEPIAKRSEEVVKVARADVANLERIERWKRHALVPIWVFLAVMAILFWAKRCQVERGDKL